MFWNVIVRWFRDRKERRQLRDEWNKAAREAYIYGTVPTLLQAEFSAGVAAYRHQYSDWLKSGFRIYAFTGRQLSRGELTDIGAAVMSNDSLVRKLVVLGFDTLEVCGDVSSIGCRWRLSDYIGLPPH